MATPKLEAVEKLLAVTDGTDDSDFSEMMAVLPPEEVYLRGLVLNYARALGTPRPEALAIKYLERYRSAQRHAAPPPVRVAG